MVPSTKSCSICGVAQCWLFKVTQPSSGIAVIVHCFIHLLGKEGKVLPWILIYPRMTGKITGLLLLVPVDFIPSEQGSAGSSPLVCLTLKGIGFSISLFIPKCPVLRILGRVPTEGPGKCGGQFPAALPAPILWETLVLLQAPAWKPNLWNSSAEFWTGREMFLWLQHHELTPICKHSPCKVSSPG